VWNGLEVGLLCGESTYCAHRCALQDRPGCLGLRLPEETWWQATWEAQAFFSYEFKGTTETAVGTRKETAPGGSGGGKGGVR
jgi:hypothetical protein